jgi:putative transposase
MPRMARVVFAGVPHHITQRGNRGEDVFFDQADRQRYMELLHEYADKHGLEVIAYCLMTNHVHLVGIPRCETTLADVLKALHTRYAQHVNWTHRLSGRLWQGRFFSCPLDESHCLAAVRYVECNPVRAGLVEKAESYRWSSAASHVEHRVNPLLSDQWREETGIEDWSSWLSEGVDEATITRLRRSTKRGRPLGSESFITHLETMTRRVLRARRVGRPSKTASNAQK